MDRSLTSAEFEGFSSGYNFTHTTSSPCYPQSNGFMEQGVKTVKKLLQKSNDPYLAVLNYRATPLNRCGWSPTELLMGRKIKILPQTALQFAPDWQFLKEFRRTDDKYKEQQKENYDKLHGVWFQSPLPVNSSVLVKIGNRNVPGSVVSPAQTPRSYLDDEPSGQERRNKSHLVTIKSNLYSESDSPTPKHSASFLSP